MIAAKGFDVGATVEYGCDDGHLLVGPSTRSCLDTGFYNEFPPVCKCKFRCRCGVMRRSIEWRFRIFADIECGLPASIPNGAYELINGSVGYLSTVVYNCNEGYEMIGRALLTCDIDERWNGPPPKCEGMFTAHSLTAIGRRRKSQRLFSFFHPSNQLLNATNCRRFMRMPKSLQQMDRFTVLALKSCARPAIKPTDQNLSLVWQPANGAHRCRLASEVN